MTKNVQHPRGTTAAEDSITGLVGQLRIDTERRELRLHDGATPGGVVIPNSTTVGEVVATAIAGAGVGVQANILIAASTVALAALTPSLYTLAILNLDDFSALYTWVNNNTHYDATQGHVLSTVTPGTYWRPVGQYTGGDLLTASSTVYPVGTVLWAAGNSPGEAQLNHEIDAYLSDNTFTNYMVYVWAGGGGEPIDVDTNNPLEGTWVIRGAVPQVLDVNSGSTAYALYLIQRVA